MQRMPAVSRPAWALALTGAGGRAGAPRRSPIEIVATMGSYVTPTQAAEFSGLRGRAVRPLGRRRQRDARGLRCLRPPLGSP
jgi:hypothetical protein